MSILDSIIRSPLFLTLCGICVLLAVLVLSHILKVKFFPERPSVHESPILMRKDDPAWYRWNILPNNINKLYRISPKTDTPEYCNSVFGEWSEWIPSQGDNEVHRIRYITPDPECHGANDYEEYIDIESIEMKDNKKCHPNATRLFATITPGYSTEKGLVSGLASPSSHTESSSTVLNRVPVVEYEVDMHSVPSEDAEVFTGDLFQADEVPMYTLGVGGCAKLILNNESDIRDSVTFVFHVNGSICGLRLSEHIWGETKSPPTCFKWVQSNATFEISNPLYTSYLNMRIESDTDLLLTNTTLYNVVEGSLLTVFLQRNKDNINMAFKMRVMWSNWC